VIDHKQALLDKIEARTAQIAVIGLGYVGLPLAVEFAKAGFRVIGIDVDPRKVVAVNAGESYIGDIPAATVAASVQSGKLPTINHNASKHAPSLHCLAPSEPDRPEVLKPSVECVETIAEGG